MNAKDLRPIHRELLPYLPSFAARKTLLLMTPMNGMLRAVDFDASAFSKDDFYVATTVMPLCVPSDHISLLFGNRLRHRTEGEHWTRKLPNLVEDLLEAIRAQALPFLERLRSADDFATMAKQFWRNPHTPKETAFVLARDGQYDRAVAIINSLLPTLNLKVGWEKGIFDDASALRRLLLTNPDEAQRKLAEWEDYTVRKLKLEAFR